MLSLIEKFLLALLILITALAFFWPITKRLRLILSGQPDNRFDRLPARFIHGFSRVFLQLCTLRVERPMTGIFHAMIFYSALTFDTMTVNHTLEGFIPGFHLFGQSRFGMYFSFLVDLFAILVLLGVLFFAFRRFVVRPKAYNTTPIDSALIYIFITLATLTYLYFETFACAHDSEAVRLSFLGSFLAGQVSKAGLSHDLVSLHFKISWWAHLVAVYAFISYVPHSKYLHIFAGPFNVFFRKEASSGELAAINLDKSEVFGLEKAGDFSWKDNLDAFACMECGRCQDECPAFASEKPLSPKMIIFNQEKHLLENYETIKMKKREALPTLVPAAFSEGEIWSCTTCGGCVNVCPVEIDHLSKIIGTRRSQVLMASNFPSELNAFFRNIETNSNPWGIGFATRADWSEGLNAPELKDLGQAETLLWVGCFGSFDEEGKKTSKAMVKILEKLQANFGILGSEEKCCGDSARRLGNEYLFQTLAAENLANFLKYGVKTIITTCPHGYNTFRNEYPGLIEIMPEITSEQKDRLRSIRVLSHVEFIKTALAEKKIKINQRAIEKYTYHDPCYLGRHNGLVVEPRRLLDSVVSGQRVELGKHGRHSFCCGAGGGLMWLEEKLGRRVNHLRSEEIIKSEVKLTVTACPFCQTMLRDGLKDLQAEKILVKDIAQLTAECLED